MRHHEPPKERNLILWALGSKPGVRFDSDSYDLDIRMSFQMNHFVIPTIFSPGVVLLRSIEPPSTLVPLATSISPII